MTRQRGVRRWVGGPLALACFALAACAMPGYQFPGGPSPWLPQGAPARVYGPGLATAPAPASRTTPRTTAAPGSGKVLDRNTAGAASVVIPTRKRAARAIDSLLVVCTGNICRSPMVAALVSERAQARERSLEVGSAGIAALVGEPPPDPVITLMRGRGIDVSGHRGRQFTGALGARHELILVMEQRQRQFILHEWPELAGRVHRLGEWRGEDVHDPYGLCDESYAQCLAHIEACVGDWEGRIFG